MIKGLVCLILTSIFLVSCASNGKSYLIGIDPSFFPTDLSGKEANVFAFSTELLTAISKEEGVRLKKLRLDFDNLNISLDEKRVDGILSSMMPRISLKQIYSFSDPYLPTGPVVVVRVDSKGNFKGKEIAVDTFNNEALLMEKYPGAVVHYYTSIPEGLEELTKDQIDGVMMGRLDAASFMQGLYYGKVKVVTPILNDEGLRLIALKGDDEIVEIFNRGLKSLKRSGKLKKLLKKWELE